MNVQRMAGGKLVLVLFYIYIPIFVPSSRLPTWQIVDVGRRREMSDREAKLSRSTDSADAHARIAELEARLASESAARSKEARARAEAEKQLSAAQKNLAKEKKSANRHGLANDNCRQGRSIRFDRVCRNSAPNAAACIEQRHVVVDVGRHCTRRAAAVERGGGG
jgi:hypothetical protein